MKEDDYIDKKEEGITIQPRFYSFDNSWEIEIQKLRKSGNLKSTIVIDRVVRSGNLFYISLVSGQLLRWCPDEVITDLIQFESSVGFGIGARGTIGTSEQRVVNGHESSQAPQIFVDQTGHHSIIVQTGGGGGGETWYLHSSQTKAKFIQKLCCYTIQCVSWNSVELSRNSSVSVIIGCRNGEILTTILGPEVSSNSIVIRVLDEIPETPILSLFLDSVKVADLDNADDITHSRQIRGSEENNLNKDLLKYQYVVTASTPNKLLLWYGQNRIIDLFLKTEESVPGHSSTYSPRSCIEIGSLDAENESSICSKIRLMIDISGHSFLVWITSKIIKIYSVNRKKRLDKDNIGSYIGNTKMYDFRQVGAKLPNSVECSRYHVIALYDEYIDVISLITAKSVVKVLINNTLISGRYVDDILCRSNNDLFMECKNGGCNSGVNENLSVSNVSVSSVIRSLAEELSNSYNNSSSLRDISCRDEEMVLLDKVSSIWGYSNENLYKINIINEGDSLWKEWLYIGMYEEASTSSVKIISKSSRLKKRCLIDKLHFLDLMIKGKMKEAIAILSKIDEDLSFNEICSIFIQYSCWEGLILYLTTKFEQLNYGNKVANSYNSNNTGCENVWNKDSNNSSNDVLLGSAVLGLWLVELNSYVSFVQEEEGIGDKYYSNLIAILEKIHKIDEIEAVVYGILVEYNRRIALNYYSELRKDWKILIQEYIFYSLIDSSFVGKCFELLEFINSNISKRDALIIKYSPILSLLDSKRFTSLLKRPSFSSININYIIPYLIEPKLLNYNNRNSNIDDTELNRFTILLIEYYISLNNRNNREHKMERASTRVKLSIHTETWKGTKTIWNVLAILCSRLDDGEELLLSYITPLLEARKGSYYESELGCGEVGKETKDYSNSGISLLEYNIDFDIPFLLSICKKRHYKKLMAYVYCLLGMYDSAMEICIKELSDTNLTKNIIYNFIENNDLRRKWILNLIKPLAYNRDIHGLTKLLNSSPKYILTLSDILSIIPDDIQLGLLSDIINNNMNQFDDIMLKRTKLYANYKLSSENLMNDLFQSHKCYNIVDPKKDVCLICHNNLFLFKGFSIENIKEFISAFRTNSIDQFKLETILSSFFTISNKSGKESKYYLFLNNDLNSNIFVFPCSHYFHFGCFLLKYSVIMNNDEISKLDRIIGSICKHSQLHYVSNNENKNQSSISSSKPKKSNVLNSLYKQLVNIVNQGCLICGEFMIRNISKSFLDDEDINGTSEI